MLASLDAEFAVLYTDFGRPSIPPERLIRASLLQILFSVRSERQLMEQIQYNLMFRWFVDLGIDDPVWVLTVFTKNRDRLLTTEMSRRVMAAIQAHREVAPLLSDEHFSIDGTLIKAWASMTSFQPKAEATPPDDEGPGDSPVPILRNKRHHRNAEVDFKGEKRSNATHVSTRGICVVPEAPKEDRRAVRLGQNHRLHGADDVSRRRTRPIRFILTMAANNLARLPRLLGA